jgi:hypothetical protein
MDHAEHQLLRQRRQEGLAEAGPTRFGLPRQGTARQVQPGQAPGVAFVDTALRQAPQHPPVVQQVDAL